MIISVLDTSVCDNNLGNQIIMDSVDGYLRKLFGSEFFIKLPYLDNLGDEAVRYIQSSVFTFLGGTNALSSEMEKYKQIGIDGANYTKIRNIILMGVGWWQYQGAISPCTQQILRHCLHSNIYHSVRDSYTRDKLGSIGINNVLVTGCPTLWPLTEEHCRQIRRGKSENVLLTFTSYSQDKSDLELFNIVQSKYKNIYVWVQGPEDLDYAKQFSDKIHILPPRLDTLDELLASDIELDYVGTRCHAGIRAMQFKRRTIIIGVDNRAIEMQKDFNLPVVARTHLSALPKILDGEFETKLNIPFDTIRQWCRQFSTQGDLKLDTPDRQIRRQVAVKPVSRSFGFDRGTPIDRYYIEKFLKANAQAIAGRVLEIGDNSYTKKCGRGVVQSDVLNAVPSKDATIVGDLATGQNIPKSAFDCIILTQTLQCIYDIKSALKNVIDALKPGGTLLMTASGISQISRYDMDRWGEYWRFTTKSLQKLFAELLPEGTVDIQSHGNVAVAKAFLDGLALHELEQQTLDYKDDDYQVILTAKVCRSPLNRVVKSAANTATRVNQSFKTPVVLLYHRVANDPIDSQLLTVSPENFEGHLKTLSENYRVLPLHQLLGEVGNGQLHPNTAAITFDDGYLDNLTHAAPLLEKYGLPATVFVTSGMVGSKDEFWWDALERIFLTGKPLPDFLNVSNPQGTFCLDLTGAQNRLKSYDKICEMVRNLPFADIGRIIEQLIGWAGQNPEGRITHRTVDPGQLKLLAASPAIEIGSHTVTHTRLSILSPENQRQEIRDSKRQLESWIKKPVRLFSYPFGGVDDFTKETIQILTQEGFEAGIANIQGDTTAPVDLYAVPRRLVRNWSALQFSQWLMADNKQRLEAQTVLGRTQKIVDVLDCINHRKDGLIANIR